MSKSRGGFSPKIWITCSGTHYLSSFGNKLKRWLEDE